MTQSATVSVRPDLAAASTIARGTAPASLDAVRPVVIVEDTGTSLIFSADGRDWSIELALRTLLSPAARAALSDADLPRFYEGQVVGEPGSWVRLARRHGVLSGHIASNGALHRLLPPETVADGTASVGTVAASAATDSNLNGGPAIDGSGLTVATTGYRLLRVGRSALHTDITSQAALRQTTRASAGGQRNGAPLVSRAMRVGIVVDSLYDAASAGEGLARALGVMNGVDGLYREQLGLAVIVDSVRVYDSSADDPLAALIDTSVDDVLTAFRQIRQADPRLPDDLALVHLFTGHRDPDAAIGLGWIGTVCRDDGYDVSMSTPFAFDTLLSAHEIGHNLGALHDEDPRCDVPGSSMPELGIMEARLSGTTTTEFSACSRQRLEGTLGADCFVDSLDLAIRVDPVDPSNATGRALVVQVENLDPWRTARAVSSRLQLPDGSTFGSLPADCSSVESQLICRHGDIAPGTEVSITAQAERVIGGEIEVSLVPGAYLDSAPDNDSMRMTVPGNEAPADDATSPSSDHDLPVAATLADPQALPMPSTSTQVRAAALPDASAGGTGILLMGLLGLFGAARRAADQVSRSTENAAMRISASR